MNEKRWRGLPFFLVSLFAAYLVMGLQTPRSGTPMDVVGFSRLPVQNGGRIKPLDTVARTSLLLLRGKQTVPTPAEDPGHMGLLGADEWLLEMLFQPKNANGYPVFEIDNPDVLGVMGIQQTPNRYYTFADLRPHLQDIEAQAQQAESIKPEQRSHYQTAISNLQDRVVLYQKLQNTLQLAGDENVLQEFRTFSEELAPQLMTHLAHGAKPSPALVAALQQAQQYDFMNEVAEFFPVPGPRGLSNLQWVSMGHGLLDAITNVGLNPAVEGYAAMGDAWRASDPAAFTKALTQYRLWLETQVPAEVARGRYEFLFNYFEPFYKSMVIYVTVFLLTLLSFLFYPRTLIRSAFYLLALAFAVHTVGLVARMILQGRPPVTNLYSSAIFVGWVAVLLGIVLERLYRNGIGSMVASVIGFCTLIIAHHLTSQGDTLEMMRAVLDSNFWLATHVVCITIGYSSTFLSGFLGILYIMRRAFDRKWNAGIATELERMIYGVICFSLLFSFVGTILGGIWADQSWGRFWGWDPKENGALMIVLWNAFILHARLGNLTKPKDMATLAVFGNIVTAFSWFGVNMLGIGLHSYGWLDKPFTRLVIFTLSQIAVISLGVLKSASKG